MTQAQDSHAQGQRGFAGKERAVGAATYSLIEATLSHDIEVVAARF